MRQFILHQPVKYSFIITVEWIKFCEQVSRLIMLYSFLSGEITGMGWASGQYQVQELISPTRNPQGKQKLVTFAVSLHVSRCKMFCDIDENQKLAFPLWSCQLISERSRTIKIFQNHSINVWLSPTRKSNDLQTEVFPRKFFSAKSVHTHALYS